MNKEKIYSCNWAGRKFTIKTGKLAQQTTSSVIAQYGGTVVLATLVQSKEEREGVNYFPLMVNLEERFYAAGIIKGSRWIKREGRPTDEAVLTGRMVDRAIRPLFNEEERKDIQIILSVLSVDQENDYDIVSLIAASAALSISDIDWKGPIAGVRIGMQDNENTESEFIINPTYEERKENKLDLTVAGNRDKIIMIETNSKEVSEEKIFQAIKRAKKEFEPILNLLNKMKADFFVSDEKINVVSNKTDDDNLNENILKAKKWLNENIGKYLFDKKYYEDVKKKSAVYDIKQKLNDYLENLGIDREERKTIINKIADKIIKQEASRAILEENKRVDGRALDEIRKISVEAGVLPRTHGSALFNRGKTQVLSVTTLAGPGLQQYLETIEGEGKKRYMHHYNFPPFSVNEVRPIFSANRREIGHGALAEKAIVPLLPDQEEFPYTVRVVSEVLSSNGSSSMASVCGSSLTLMDAGVPIKKAVAGIAIGLASNKDMSQWKILTDIQDLEDGDGGMDFKIAGTKDGITAIQMDTKTLGLTDDIIKQALERGKKARLEILEKMNQVIDKPRPELSPYAPRIISFHINPDKIREVIGPNGKVINKIINETGATIDIEDDGSVTICSVNKDELKKAVDHVKDIVREFKVGEEFTGPVKEILDFGAIVEIVPGHEGMVHISELANYRVGKVEDIVKIGQIITVKIIDIDQNGRIKLSLRQVGDNRQQKIFKKNNNFHKRKNKDK